MFENQKPEILYPCQWEYKLIGQCQNSMKQAVEAKLAGRKFFLEVSQTSAKGKYISLRLCLDVESQSDRDEIFSAFQNHTAFKMVL